MTHSALGWEKEKKVKKQNEVCQDDRISQCCLHRGMGNLFQVIKVKVYKEEYKALKIKVYSVITSE